MKLFMSATALAIVCAVSISLAMAPRVHAESQDEVILAKAPSIATTSEQSDSGEQRKENKPSKTKIKIKPGDTLSALAIKHDTTVSEIVQLNKSISDPDLIAVGQTIKVTSSANHDNKSNSYQNLRLAVDSFLAPPPVAQNSAPTYSVKSAANSYTPVKTYSGSSAGNTYAWGNCTWYVKERKPHIPNLWGDAGQSWLSGAMAAGYATGAEARVGAIGVQPGHVVVIESVNSDGTVSLSEMNWNGGIGIVHQRTAPASSFTYIYA